MRDTGRPSSMMTLQWGGRVLPVGHRTIVMGVLNVTPDSFYDGGSYVHLDVAVARGLEMAAEGADVIDVGGESTRPGAEAVPAAEEIRRVVPVIRELRKRLPETIISIDTTKAAVADEALDAGASVVNDISGLGFDRELGPTAARHGAGLVLMHIQNRPANMQDDPHYDDVVEDVYADLSRSLDRAMTAGVPREAVVVDPGIGFGKTLEHNLSLLDGLERFHALGRPVMVGTSRKSFIGRILDAQPDQRLEGSLASAVSAVHRGAHLVRVHDVLPTVRALRVADAIRRRRCATLRAASC